METINNMATAAAKAVWGDGDAKKEPVSGVKGDVAKGEPYDAGNLDPAKQNEISSTNGPSTNAPSSNAQSRDVPPVNPAKANTVPSDNTSGQNDTRDPEDPKTAHAPGDQGDVDTSGEGPNDIDFDSPGPKPIAQVAKEHGGDAGNLGKDGVKVGNDSKTSISSSSSSSSEEELPKGPTNEKKKPTGDVEYLKSSGVAADGGNFDASNPGAGADADRLLEQKGIHREDSPKKGPLKKESSEHIVDKTASNGSSGSGTPTKTKVSLKEKIKAKLHSH